MPPHGSCHTPSLSKSGSFSSDPTSRLKAASDQNRVPPPLEQADAQRDLADCLNKIAALHQATRRDYAKAHAKHRDWKAAKEADGDEEGEHIRALIDETCQVARKVKDSDAFAWLPRSEEETTLPRGWLLDNDDLLSRPDVHLALGNPPSGFLDSLSFRDHLVFKFLVCRSFDVEDAAECFLIMRDMFLTYELTFRCDHPDVVAGMRQGVFFTIPQAHPKDGAPIIAQLPRRLRWCEGKHGMTVSEDGRMSTTGMLRAWMYAMMCTVYWAPTTQTHGIVLVNDLEGVGSSNAKSDFMMILAKGIRFAVPLKVKSVLLANEGKFFSMIIWPVVKRAISKKIRDRVHVVGKDYAKCAEFAPAELLPVGTGGARELDSDAARAEMLAGLDMRKSHAPTHG
jgi:hypothetical protein